MCGIAGQVRLAHHSNLPPIKALDLEKMCQAMIHRGPDQQGIRLFKHAGLGMRRLRIIDLSSQADQPMTNEDESLWLIYNGEIYNYRELRKDLLAKGHRFRSQTDSEVVLHGYEEWGMGLLDKLDGMFAFALYRQATHSLLLARDPFGIKPLYYYQSREEIYFASEIRALLTQKSISARLHTEMLSSYLTLGYVPCPETMFAGIKKLPPGHTLELTQGKIAITAYFDLNRELGQPCNLSEMAEKIKLGVQSSLVADVPLGVFLSGGLDSALLGYYASLYHSEPIKTFSIGFSGYPKFDETAKSSGVAEMLGSDHHTLAIEEEASLVIGKVVRALEEPLADPSIIPTYHLAAMTKGFVTVALSGEGGDELFAGYNRYYWDQSARQFGGILGKIAPVATALLSPLHRATAGKPGFSNFIRRSLKMFQTASLTPASRYLAWFALLSQEQITGLLAPQYQEIRQASSLSRTEQHFHQLFSAANFNSSLKQMQYVDIRTMLLDNLLLKADKIGMSQSLEMRVPLLNRSLATTLFHLPDAMKIKHGVTKVSERELLRPIFGNDFVEQRKQGFEVPIGDWLRQKGAHLIYTLLAEDSMSHGVWDKKAVSQLLKLHMDGKRNLGLPLFAIGVFNLWMKEFSVKT